MKKLKYIIAITLIVILGASMTTRIAFGADLTTIVKQIIEKHIYYIDDVEVTESEYNSLDDESETVEVTIEHRRYTKYLINGKEVTLEIYKAYLDELNKEEEYETFEYSFTNWNESTRVDLADYLDWEESGIGVTIGSDKVVGVKYEYSDGIMSYTDGTHYSGCCANCYQMTEKTNGLWFTVGLNTGIEYDIVKEAKLNVGDYLFKFVNNDSYADIKFADVFKSVTLVIKK